MSMISNAQIYINGNPIAKFPSKFDITWSDLDKNTTRTGSGQLKRNRVRGGSSVVHAIEVEWTNLSQSEMEAIMNQISGVSFKLKFLDLDGLQKEKKFYASDRKAVTRSYDRELSKIMYSSLTCQFTEY